MRIESFHVVPALPEKLEGLREMAYNLLWTWDEDLRVLFLRLDRALWDSTYQNPVLMLGSIAQERLEALAADDSFTVPSGAQPLRNGHHEEVELFA